MSTDEILSKLPGREDLLARLPAAQPQRRTGEELLTAVGVFGAGIVVGAGLALLFAPGRGRELRRELGEKVERARGPGDGESRVPMSEAGT